MVDSQSLRPRQHMRRAVYRTCGRSIIADFPCLDGPFRDPSALYRDAPLLQFDNEVKPLTDRFFKAGYECQQRRGMRTLPLALQRQSLGKEYADRNARGGEPDR